MINSLHKAKSELNKLVATEKIELDHALSRHTRNALLDAGLRSHDQVMAAVKTGDIFRIPRLGVVGVKEAIVWALNK